MTRGQLITFSAACVGAIAALMTAQHFVNNAPPLDQPHRQTTTAVKSDRLTGGDGVGAAGRETERKQDGELQRRSGTAPLETRALPAAQGTSAPLVISYAEGQPRADEASRAHRPPVTSGDAPNGTNLRDAAITAATEEIWNLTQTSAQPSSARAVTARVISASISRADPALVASSAPTSTSDCRTTYTAPPDPKDDSPAAKAWRDSIAESDANIALAEKWRRSIWAGTSDRWIKDAYDRNLRCRGDVPAGWLSEVRWTGNAALSPLRWMCDHGFDSPLWTRHMTAVTDRPSDVAYSFVRINGGPWSTYGVPRLFKVDVPIASLPDPKCQHCEIPYDAPCMQQASITVTWELDPPGRIQPGPRALSLDADAIEAQAAATTTAACVVAYIDVPRGDTSVTFTFHGEDGTTASVTQPVTTHPASWYDPSTPGVSGTGASWGVNVPREADSLYRFTAVSKPSGQKYDWQVDTRVKSRATTTCTALPGSGQ